MERMTERNFPCCGQIECYINYTGMTSVTAAGDTKSNICIMAGATGTIFFHLPHGVSAALFTPGKYPAVTVRTDIHFFDRIGVYLMAEGCRNLFEADIR